MKKLMLLALLLVAGRAEAQQCAGFGGTQVTPFAYEAVTVSSTAIGLTSATFATGAKTAVIAVLTLETDSIRFRVDGGVPTSTVGQLVTQASNVSVLLCGTTAIRNFRAIRTNTDASLKVAYYAAGN